MIDAGFVDSLRLGGGDVHGDVVGELFVAADHVDENADTGAMDILFNEALSFDAGEAAERHVFADLADESLADAFNRGFTERELEERVRKLEAQVAYLKKSIALKAELGLLPGRGPRP